MDNLHQMGAGGFGAGNVTLQELAELQNVLRKTLNAGYGSPITAIGALTGGQALVPQSIEPMLAFVQADLADQVKLWPKIVKTGTGSTVHEYRRVRARTTGQDPFVGEGVLAATNTSTFDAGTLRIKYLGDTRMVSKTMDVLTTLGLPGMGTGQNAVAIEQRMGMENVLIGNERALFFADSTANTFAYDGIRATLEANAPNNIFDLRGANLTEERMRQDMATVWQRSFAKPSEIWTSPTTQEILGLLRGGSAIYRDNKGEPIVAGLVVNKVPSANGLVSLDNNLALAPEFPPAAASSSSAPAMPAGAGAPAYVAGPVAPGEVSLFTAADNGNYRYQLVAYGPGGCSAPSASGVVPVVAGQKVTLTVGTGAEQGITFFRIYKSPVGGAVGSETFIDEIAYNTAGVTTWTDLHTYIGGTTWAFGVDYRPDVFQFKRLLDFMSWPIPWPAPVVAFMVMMFGAPLFQIPTKLGPAWRNCGQST